MSIGLALAFLAVLGWGAGDVFARKAMATISPPVVTIGIAALSVPVLVVFVAVGDGLDVLLRLPWHVYILIALMGFLSHVSGNLLYLWGMRRAGLALVSPVIASVPLFSVLLAVVFGGERPNLPTLLGAALVITGVMLVVTDRHRVLRR